MSVYQRIRQLLEDGKWHSERELEELVTFPKEWITELRHDPDTIVQEVEGQRFVRLTDGE